MHLIATMGWVAMALAVVAGFAAVMRPRSRAELLTTIRAFVLVGSLLIYMSGTLPIVLRYLSASTTNADYLEAGFWTGFVALLLTPRLFAAVRPARAPRDAAGD